MAWPFGSSSSESRRHAVGNASDRDGSHQMVRPLCFVQGTWSTDVVPRSPRADETGVLYHALNRANLGAKIFRKEGDFIAFEKVLHEALQLYKVELYACQIMGTHWHLILRPLVDGEMGRFFKRGCGTHTMRRNAHYHMTGKGSSLPGPLQEFSDSR